MGPSFNCVLKAGMVGLVLTFTVEVSSANSLWDKIWGKVPVAGKIKEMAEAGGESRKQQESKLDEFFRAEDENRGGSVDLSNLNQKKVKDMGSATAKGVEAGGEAYGEVIGKIAPDMKTGLDAAEKGANWLDRIFGKNSKPKDVDKALENLPNLDSKGGALQDDHSGKGGAMDTIRQTDVGRESTDAIGNRPQPQPVAPNGNGMCPGHM